MSGARASARAVPVGADEPASLIAGALLDLISRIPDSDEQPSPVASDRAHALATAAAKRSALTAGALALPPGPLGWLTLLPEIFALWRIQAQLVADIAAAFGQSASLSREQMLYCLFRHAAAQAVRDLAVQVGGRLIVRRASLSVLQTIAGVIGIRISQRLLGKGIARWLPVLGALGVGTYAYFDTLQVARTATDLFGKQHSLDTLRRDGATARPTRLLPRNMR